MTLTKKQAIIRIRQCHQQRTKIKQMAESLSFKYRHQLAAAKEAAGEIKTAVYI